MKFIKHKDLNISLDQMRAIAAGEPIPEGSGIAVDIGEDFISFSPEDETNIFGRYGKGTDYILAADYDQEVVI